MTTANSADTSCASATRTLARMQFCDWSSTIIACYHRIEWLISIVQTTLPTDGCHATFRQQRWEALVVLPPPSWQCGSRSETVGQSKRASMSTARQKVPLRIQIRASERRIRDAKAQDPSNLRLLRMEPSTERLPLDLFARHGRRDTSPVRGGGGRGRWFSHPFVTRLCAPSQVPLSLSADKRRRPGQYGKDRAATKRMMRDVQARAASFRQFDQAALNRAAMSATPGSPTRIAHQKSKNLAVRPRVRQAR